MSRLVGGTQTAGRLISERLRRLQALKTVVLLASSDYVMQLRSHIGPVAALLLLDDLVQVYDEHLLCLGTVAKA